MAERQGTCSRRAVLGMGLGMLSGCAATTRRTTPQQNNVPAVVTSSNTATPTPEPTPAEPRVGTDLGEPVEWFFDAERWSALGDTRASLDGGAATDESPTPARGEWSLRVEAPGGAEVLGEFSDDPLDFRDRSISIGLYADVPERQPSFYVTLYAPDSENAVRYCCVYPGDDDAGWQRFDLSVDHVVGSPDLSSVEKIWIRASTSERTRFWLDDIRAMPKPDRGKVMLMFDDISASQYDVGYDVLSDHGLRGAYAVVTGIVGDDKRISAEELATAEDDGWELLSHSVTGDTMPSLDRQTRRTYLAESKQWLRDHARNPETAEQFVFPQSDYDEPALRDTSDFYEMSYVSGKGSSVALSDWRTVTRRAWEKEQGDSLLSAVDRAAERRELLAYTFHDIRETQRPRFRKLAEYLAEAEAEGRIDVITPTELMALQDELAGSD